MHPTHLASVGGHVGGQGQAGQRRAAKLLQQVARLLQRLQLQAVQCVEDFPAIAIKGADAGSLVGEGSGQFLYELVVVPPDPDLQTLGRVARVARANRRSTLLSINRSRTGLQIIGEVEREDGVGKGSSCSKSRQTCVSRPWVGGREIGGEPMGLQHHQAPQPPAAALVADGMGQRTGVRSFVEGQPHGFGWAGRLAGPTPPRPTTPKPTWGCAADFGRW